MACNDYLPPFMRQLTPSDPYGKYNCTAWSAAMAAAYHSCGGILTTGTRIRALSNEPIPHRLSPGLNLDQVDDVLRIHFGIDLDERRRYPWAEFVRRINAGEGAILQVYYGPIADSRFDAGRGFRGNHAMFVPPGWGVMDTLADGRATGVYKYKGEAYPQSLLRRAAGQLIVGATATGAPIRLGDGYVYAAFTKDNRETPKTYRLAFSGPAFWVYTVSNGVITGRYAKRFSGPTSAPCTAPATYRWPAQNTSRALVRMTAGVLAGQYVGIPQGTVTLMES